MDDGTKLRVLRCPAARRKPPFPTPLRRRRPRDFFEWAALRRWKRLSPWEARRPGYLLRLARERSGRSQADLAALLGCSQQAVAQSERWDSNPTVETMERWAAATASHLVLDLVSAAAGDPVASDQGRGAERGARSP